MSAVRAAAGRACLSTRPGNAILILSTDVTYSR